MLNKILIFVISFAIFAGVSTYIGKPGFPQIPGELLFQNINGEKLHFNDLAGKPALIAFWSPACAICLKEVDQLNRLYTEHQGKTGFNLLATSMYYDKPDWVIKTSQEVGMEYPVFFDLQKHISNAFGGIVATPTLFLVDNRGNIVLQHQGPLDVEHLKLELSKLTG
jgi:peroxiredoxin